ncbi:condensation domain-containing protein, partial [Streptomyces sp. 5-6(2022)]|uniref:condensation domain-containing protein n=1 Tax=Streptomyces sp. 5-6(2022) TaxID=2936510 RepID=UPI0023B8E075
GDVVARHESLRTRFPHQDGQPYQDIVEADQARVELPVIEVAEADVDRAIAEAAARTFDLTSDLPVRAALFALSPADTGTAGPPDAAGAVGTGSGTDAPAQLASRGATAEGCVLVVVVHHIAGDGW